MRPSYSHILRLAVTLGAFAVIAPLFAASFPEPESALIQATATVIEPGGSMPVLSKISLLSPSIRSGLYRKGGSFDSIRSRFELLYLPDPGGVLVAADSPDSALGRVNLSIGNTEIAGVVIGRPSGRSVILDLSELTGGSSAAVVTIIYTDI
jgi:hypothetical protein